MLAVVVGVIVNAHQQVLIAQRPTQKSYSGYWEFPGGKIEHQETPYQALVRELREELNITVITAVPWKQMEYSYPERTIALHLWIVSSFSGNPQGMENQAFQWVSLEQLSTVDFLPANKIILSQLIKHFAACKWDK